MDADELQGIWRHGAATITVTGWRFTTAQMGASYEGCFELDEAASPKRITLHFDVGPEAGNTNHGIYSLRDAEWRLCIDTHGGPAPVAFTEAATLVYTRSVEPGPAVDGEPVAELQGEWAMVRCIRAGEPLPAAFAKQGRRRIAGVEATLRFGPQPFSHGSLLRDGDGAFRLVSSSGEAPQLGIFTISGERLRTCTGAPGMARPTVYESTKEGGETYTEWKRP